MQNSRARFFQGNLLAVAAFAGAAMFATSASAQVAGVENFHQVNDHIYRGAQPTTAGFQSLAKLGVKTVIDLRETDGRSALEKKAVEANGMRYVNVPLQGMSAPPSAAVEKVMALFNDASAGPVFIHCRRGADRTGTLVACYRIAHDGWENTKALNEAKTDGMSWVEVAMQHYVLRYQPTTVATNSTATVTAQQ
ncbi:MAG: tyrosine-protein phosphatase [Bryobacteraceae bacterium]|jgi:tyrosine-protein phosphatase SIW14